MNIGQLLHNYDPFLWHLTQCFEKFIRKIDRQTPSAKFNKPWMNEFLLPINVIYLYSNKGN